MKDKVDKLQQEAAAGSANVLCPCHVRSTSTASRYLPRGTYHDTRPTGEQW